MSLAERINTLYLILKTICCKKVDHFSEILRKYKSKKPKPAAKNFFRQKKVSYFLSKYETLPIKFVLFSTLSCLIVGREEGWGV